MIGCMPSVTPPNWCSIATGCWPRTHGVTCYNNQTLGSNLTLEEVNWTSENVTADFIWESFSKAGKRSIALSYCEAWPPRIPKDEYGVFIDGSGVVPFLRSGIDYQKVVTLEEGDFQMEFIPHSVKNDNLDCIIMGNQYEEMKAKSVDRNASCSSWAMPAGVLDYPSGVEDLEPAADIAASVADHEEAYRPSKADKIKTPLKNPTNKWFGYLCA